MEQQGADASVPDNGMTNKDDSGEMALEPAVVVVREGTERSEEQPPSEQLVFVQQDEPMPKLTDCLQGMTDELDAGLVDLPPEELHLVAREGEPLLYRKPIICGQGMIDYFPYLEPEGQGMGQGMVDTVHPLPGPYQPQIIQPNYGPPRPSDGDDVVDTATVEPANQRRCIPNCLMKAVDRVMDLLQVPMIIIFGIILYLLDVGTDTAAAVVYFQHGHPVWGSLTITFVLVPSLCCAAFSWTYWYYDSQKDRRPKYRILMMVLSVPVLDQLVR